MPEDAEYVPKKDFIDTQRRLYEMEARFEAIKGERDKKSDEILRLKKKLNVESTAKEEKREETPPAPTVPPITIPIPATVTYNPPVSTQNSVTNPSFSPPITVTNSPVQTEARGTHPDHTFKVFQAGCTTCGTKNEKFIPEMKCKTCKNVVGSFEAIRDMDYCPHCTNKLTAIPITDEAKRKVQEYLATPKVAVTA